MTTIGIDNGSTGTIGIITPELVLFEEVPTKKCLVGKAGKLIKRIDVKQLMSFLQMYAGPKTHAYVERPFTGRFLNAVLPAQRSFEAVLIALELLDIGYTVIDSKEWQSSILGQIKGSSERKNASMIRGREMYPNFASQIEDHGDADGLMIAHYYSKMESKALAKR